MTGLAHITLHLLLPAWGTIISPAFLLRFGFLSLELPLYTLWTHSTCYLKIPACSSSLPSPSLVSFNPPPMPRVSFPPTTLTAPSACYFWGSTSSYSLEVQQALGSLLFSLYSLSLKSRSHNYPAIIFVLTVHIHLCSACPRTSAHSPQLINFLLSRFSSPSHRPSTGHCWWLKPYTAIFRRGSDFAAVFSATSPPPYLDSYILEYFCK